MDKPPRVQFRLGTVPLPHRPEWHHIKHTLSIQGIPCPFRGDLFRPILTPFWVTTSQQLILVFGRRGMSQALGIDCQTHEVTEILDAPTHPISFVNSSIDLFTKAVSCMAEQYPFSDTESEYATSETAANRLKQQLLRIDPSCMQEDSLWGELYWDVTQGDWAGDDSHLWQVDWSLYEKTPPPWWLHPRFFFQPSLDAIRLTGKEAQTLIGELDGQ